MQRVGDSRGEGQGNDFGDLDDEETGEQAVLVPNSQGAGQAYAQAAVDMALDIGASIVFWYLIIWHFSLMPFHVLSAFLCALALMMLLWRLRVLIPGAQRDSLYVNVPYTCGIVDTGSRKLYVVATLHISPRAARDVETVMHAASPDVVMIELDRERLDRMGGDHAEPSPSDGRPVDSDNELDTSTLLQPVTIREGSKEPVSILAQRAYWNAEWSDQLLSSHVVFNENDPYGLGAPDDNVVGKFWMVLRGTPDSGTSMPLALKVQSACDAGAKALFVINHTDSLPNQRLGAATPMTTELSSAVKTWNCGLPPLPALLFSHSDGKRLTDMLARVAPAAVTAEFRVLEDDYPRRTLRRRLCQGFALLFSGIGILYGIIQCFWVEVGGEFLAAQRIAHARSIPCLCIDVDLDGFWSKLGASVVPTPSNVCQSVLSWLAFPRVLRGVLFPRDRDVDVIGSTVLHLLSLPLRTWIAYVIAVYLASCFTSFILKLFTYGAVEGAEASGAVTVKSDKERHALQDWLILLAELYMYPRLYDAVCTSRDEAMYQGIVAKSGDAVSSIVVVVGAAHANGILSRVRSQGV